MRIKSLVAFLFLFFVLKESGTVCGQYFNSQWDVIGPTVKGQRYSQHFDHEKNEITEQKVTAVKKDGRKKGSETCLKKGNFDSITSAENSNDIIIIKDGKKGYYSYNTGKFLEPEYEDVALSKNGVFKVKDNGKWNELDSQGNKIPNEEDKRIQQISQTPASKIVGTWKEGSTVWVFRANGTGQVKIDNSDSYWNDRKYTFNCNFKWKKDDDWLKLTYISSTFNNISQAMDALRVGMDYEEYFKRNPYIHILAFNNSSMKIYFKGTDCNLSRSGK